MPENSLVMDCQSKRNWAVNVINTANHIIQAVFCISDDRGIISI